MKACFIEKVTSDSAHAAIADLMEVGQSLYLLTRINVPQEHRGKGIGSKILDKVCLEADEEQAVLELHPVPSGGLTKTQLVKWYKRRGFVSERSGVLRRYPKKGY